MLLLHVFDKQKKSLNHGYSTPTTFNCGICSKTVIKMDINHLHGYNLYNKPWLIMETGVYFLWFR